jgi:arylsulfatase
MTWEFAGYGGIVAVRDGNWKIVRRNLKRKNTESWELYDVVADPSESKDLAKQHPEVVQRMESAYLSSRTREPDFPLPIFDSAE